MGETISFHLFPRSPFFWLVWVASMLIVFPVYYIDNDYYHAMSKQHENDKWIECGSGSTCEEIGLDATGTWKVYVRQPQYVADFVESPIEIKLTNVLTTTQSAVLTIDVVPVGESKNRYVHYRIGESKQNFINVDNIQAKGQASYEVMIRVVGGQDEEQFILNVSLNGQPIRNGYDFSQYPITFHSIKMLRLWAEAYLLSPPAANLVIPVVLLLMVSFSQMVYFMSGKLFEMVFALLPEERNLRKIVESISRIPQLLFNFVNELRQLNFPFSFRQFVQIASFALAGWFLWKTLRVEWFKYSNEIEKVLASLQALPIDPGIPFVAFAKNILWALIIMGFLWGIIEQSLKYRKDRNVQKIKVTELPRDGGVV